MSASSLESKCQQCSESIQEIPTKTLFGIRKIVCQRCQSVNYFPMTSGYRIGFWALLIWAVFYTLDQISKAGFGYIIATSNGPLFAQAVAELSIPVLLVAALAYGVFKDISLQKKYNVTERIDKK